MSKLKGSNLAGTSTSRNRVDNDFYATDPSSVNMLLKEYDFYGKTILEPCVGQGHIANTIDSFYLNKKEITTLDIVDRGYKNTIVQDFLTWKTNKKFEAIITNPPYSLAKEFVEKGMSLLTEETKETVRGQMAMFLKIKFLEGVKRKEMFKKYPPRYVYVFSKRQNPWRNGSPVNEKGKPWCTTMCFAWFIWEKGFKGEPIIRWL